MITEVSYRRSLGELDVDKSVGTLRRLSISFRRFSVLERVLSLAVFVFVVLVIVLGILYASSKKCGKNSDKDTVEKQEKVCLTAQTAQCVSSALQRSLDWSVDPCDDFYNFACNKWLAEQDVSGSMCRITQFDKVEEENYKFLREKLHDAATFKKYEDIEAVSKALNDYTACMAYENVSDEAKSKQAHNFISEYGGWNISTPQWTTTEWQLMPNLIKIHRDLNVFPLFSIAIVADIKNTTQNQIRIVPRASDYLRRESFFSNDSFFTTLRTHYQNLMLSAISLIANAEKDDPVIKRQVDEIYEYEKLLAEISMPTEQAGQRERLYNPITIDELQSATGITFNWTDYFKGVFNDTGVVITTKTVVYVNQLEFLKNMTQTLNTTDDVVLANYMMWEVICQTYSYFPREIKEKFVRYKNSLWGTWGKTDLWESCVRIVRDGLGLPLSVLYLDEKFGSEKFERIEDMVAGLREAFVNDLKNVTWMDPETKRMALKKAKTIKQNVGFPKILLDTDALNKRFEELDIKKNDYVGNSIRKRKYLMKRKLESLDVSEDNSYWPLDLFSTYAYYSATENKIVFPAGILQPPFFDISRPMSLNYGGIGMIIGRKLTHSFGNTGQPYNKHGNYFNWWQNSSPSEFEKRATCLEKKYSQYSFFSSKINSNWTLHEHIADNGGLQLAFQAYQTWSEKHSDLILPALNLTNNQLFFIGSAQTWCSKYHDYFGQSVPWWAHAPGMIRVTGTLSNYPEFAKSFKCALGSRMNPKEKCDIW